jgi:hypothetical protein
MGRGHYCPRNLTTIKTAKLFTEAAGVEDETLIRKIFGAFFAGKACPEFVEGSARATRSPAPW